MAPGEGFEPPFLGPEPIVLPLDEPGMALATGFEPVSQRLTAAHYTIVTTLERCSQVFISFYVSQLISVLLLPSLSPHLPLKICLLPYMLCYFLAGILHKYPF